MKDEKYIITSDQLKSEKFAGFTLQDINELKSHKLSKELKQYRKQILKEAIDLILAISEDPYCHAGRSEMVGHSDCLKILRNMVKS